MRITCLFSEGNTLGSISFFISLFGVSYPSTVFFAYSRVTKMNFVEIIGT